MSRHILSITAVALLALGAHGAGAQRGAVAIEQITPRPPASAAARVAPVRGAKSSNSGQEAPRERAAQVVAPEIVEACRKAQAEDRPAPNGVDCLAVAQALGQDTSVSAEGALLPLFGQAGNVTGAPAVQGGPFANADAVARQLATGDIQAGAANGAAAIAGRERAAPPPNSPR
ncbi:MAG: hypothetical protein M3Q08_11210 [Pseudomonadota bacterium]|nr:hypothetical protein [Pseudomonadota bacterium]